jgi:hypothetical protein
MSSSMASRPTEQCAHLTALSVLTSFGGSGSRICGHRGGEQTAKAVQVCCRTQVKLDPVSPGRITPDRRISTEAVLDLRPSGPGDPQVDHAGRLQVSDFPAGSEQGRLIAIARPTFHDRARREHGDDESLPERVTAVIAHCRQDKSRIREERLEARSVFTHLPQVGYRPTCYCTC